MTAAEPLIEVELPAPGEEVWAHLRDPGLIRRWFGWEYEGLEGEIEFIFLGPPPEALAGMPEGAGFEVDDGAPHHHLGVRGHRPGPVRARRRRRRLCAAGDPTPDSPYA